MPKPRDRRYSSARWLRLRQQIIRRDGRRCSVSGCSSDMREPQMMQVDHIVEVKDGGAFWDPNNLRLVCRFHHYAKTVELIGQRQSGGQVRQSVRFPPDGHWNDRLNGREWASPNSLACDNRLCRRCIVEGYRKEKE